MPALMADRPCFDVMPARNKDASLLMWEQLDNFLGLQQVRGLGAELPRVKKVGLKRYQMIPGYYGEFIDLDETELTERRQIGTFASPANISDLVAMAQDQLLQRRLDRIEFLIWTLLATGTFSVAGPTGNILHTDTFTTQTFTASPTWATVATATPIADFRAIALLGRGKGVNFGAQARAYMNQSTANVLLANTNAADIGGRLTAQINGIRPINTIPAINQYFIEASLPQIVVYDGGYLDDAASFQLFVPNNKVIIVGQRPAGQTIGEWWFTRNLLNRNGAPGPTMRVLDQGETHFVPRIDVGDGWAGGPVLLFPSAVVIATV